MRHHTAAQKGDGGGWHYVSLGSRGGYPIGYCSEHEPHATEAEARDCYGRYQRDNIRLDVQFVGWTDCDVCGAATKTGAGIRGNGYRQAALCSDHLTLEHAREALHLNQPAGDAWVS